MAIAIVATSLSWSTVPATGARPATFDGPVSADPLMPAERAIPPGRLRLPIDPKPRCNVLDNFGDSRGSRSHAGVDILATLGQPVVAVERMRLTRKTIDGATNSSLSGNAWWALGLSSGDQYFYAHLSDFAKDVDVGSIVDPGRVIGYVGDTGNPGAGNYHLHFELQKYNSSTRRFVPIDPLPILVVPSSCTIW